MYAPAGLRGAVTKGPDCVARLAWSSVTELVEDAFADYAQNQDAREYLHDLQKRRAGSSWANGHTAASLRKALEEPATDLLAAIEGLRSELVVELAVPTTTRRKLRRGQDWGDELDSDRCLNREPIDPIGAGAQMGSDNGRIGVVDPITIHVALDRERHVHVDAGTSLMAGVAQGPIVGCGADSAVDDHRADRRDIPIGHRHVIAGEINVAGGSDRQCGGHQGAVVEVAGTAEYQLPTRREGNQVGLVPGAGGLAKDFQVLRE